MLLDVLAIYFKTEWRNIAAAHFLIVCNKADSFRVQMENKKGCNFLQPSSFWLPNTVHAANPFPFI